jgi:hypothetical protein
VVPWGAFAAGLVAVSVALWNQLQTRRERRRNLYSEAYRAGVSWAELYYRVRRRDGEGEQEIVAMFHDAQEAIDYHEGWLSIESESLGRAYRRFVSSIKTAAGPLIQQAWNDDPVKAKDGITPDSGIHLDLGDAKDVFLGDVADHLSPWPWRWVALKMRYKD